MLPTQMRGAAWVLLLMWLSGAAAAAPAQSGRILAEAAIFDVRPTRTRPDPHPATAASPSVACGGEWVVA